MATATGIKCSLKQNNFQKEVNKRPDARLSANSLFRNVSEESIARILVCSGAKFRTIRRMRRYFDKGSRRIILCFIKGKCVDYQLYAFWKSECLISCCTGALIGEHYSSNLDTNGRVYWYEAVACEPVEVLAVPWQYLYGFCDKACDHHKQLIQNLYESMSTKEWMAVRKLNVLGFASVQERAAAWLLQETDASDTVVLKTNREEQADYLCVARPSLSRTLMQMQKAGLIEADRKQIRILDREKLEKIL